MKICYSIDALSPSGDKAWRLQKDGTWRPCRYAEPLQENDARLTDQREAENWIGRRLKKDKKKGLIAKDKAGPFDFWMRGIFAHAVIHRFSDAVLPDKQQMIETIAGLAPGIPWLLYLDAEGIFHGLDTRRARINGNLDIAVRGEIASSEDYIGPKAAANEAMMDELYRQFLSGWLEHLKTSRMNVFITDVEKLNDEGFYLEAIRNWKHE